ncbi:MAG: class E sortase [Ornithinimicrobium sp.]
MRIAIRTLGELFITVGVLLLLFLVWQLWWTDVEANAESRDILQTTRAVFTGEEIPADLRVEPARGTGPTGAALAIVYMPTIGETRAVLDGVELSVLNQGVLGQYPDSEDPGEVGNFAVAGHRTTYGRPLWNVANLQPGDPIIVETKDDYFVYRFDRIQIVTPYQTEVIADVPGDSEAEAIEQWMVMTACHPKFSAAQRIVAFNSFDYQQPRSQGMPAELGG